MNRGGRGGFSRGRGRGGSGTTGSSISRLPLLGSKNPSTTPDSVPMDVVRPVLPALYPEYSEGVSVDGMDREVNCLVSDFSHFQEFLRSNYSVDFLESKETGFEVEKFTDTYDDPFRVEPRLEHYISKKFFPSELYTKKSGKSKPQRKQVKKEVDTTEILEKYTIKEEKRDSDEDEIEEEELKRKRELENMDTTRAENLELEKVAKSLDPEMGEGDEDEEDEVDEEMDEGNDYMNDYFDNGEDYLSEDDALEEGDVF